MHDRGAGPDGGAPGTTTGPTADPTRSDRVPAPAGTPLPPDGGGRRFELHAFVCTKGPSCPVEGPAEAIRRRLKQHLVAAGMKEEVRINNSGCLGQCGHGPLMVVYPEGIWYAHLREEDADRIWEQHILGGRPVDELRFRTRRGGTNVLPKDVGADAPVDVESPWFDPCSRCPDWRARQAR